MTVYAGLSGRAAPVLDESGVAPLVTLASCSWSLGQGTDDLDPGSERSPAAGPTRKAELHYFEFRDAKLMFRTRPGRLRS